MTDSLLTLFQTAYRNLDLLPLLDQKDLARFRVEYGGEVIEELVQLVEDSGAADSKIIFSGHRGCGKSTLLAEFSRSPLLGDGYFVVLFSIAQVIEMSDVDHINILFAIALNLMVEAEKNQVEILKSTQDAIYQWFAEQTTTDFKELKGEAKAGINLLDIVSLQLQTNAGVRKEIKQKFERNTSELVSQLNIIAATLQAATKKTILVIIDDLDKLELSVVRPIFRDSIKTLCLPGFHIIYTIPMATLRDKEILPVLETETNNQMVRMPVLKLFKQEESHNPSAVPKAEVMDTLCEILHKRIPDRLLDRQTAEKMIVYSGGVLRELIRIANECCRICLRLIRRDLTQPIKIDEAILEEAVNKLRNDFALRLGKVDYEILPKIYTEFMPDDPTQKEFLDLLHGLHVLEYRNRRDWYDVHPIVVELLRDRNLI
ncbi:P-loop NTPase fold protein [Phormidesmis priestleyi]